MSLSVVTSSSTCSGIFDRKIRIDLRDQRGQGLQQFLRIQGRSDIESNIHQLAVLPVRPENNRRNVPFDMTVLGVPRQPDDLGVQFIAKQLDREVFSEHILAEVKLLRELLV